MKKPRHCHAWALLLVEQGFGAVESAAFAASLTDCEVESEVRPSFPGYCFRESDPPVRMAADGTLNRSWNCFRSRYPS